MLLAAGIAVGCSASVPGGVAKAGQAARCIHFVFILYKSPLLPTLPHIKIFHFAGGGLVILTEFTFVVFPVTLLTSSCARVRSYRAVPARSWELGELRSCSTEL